MELMPLIRFSMAWMIFSRVSYLDSWREWWILHCAQFLLLIYWLIRSYRAVCQPGTLPYKKPKCSLRKSRQRAVWARSQWFLRPTSLLPSENLRMALLLALGASMWKSDSSYKSSSRILCETCFSLKNFMVPALYDIDYKKAVASTEKGILVRGWPDERQNEVCLMISAASLRNKLSWARKEYVFQSLEQQVVRQIVHKIKWLFSINNGQKIIQELLEPLGKALGIRHPSSYLP